MTSLVALEIPKVGKAQGHILPFFRAPYDVAVEDCTSTFAWTSRDNGLL